MKRILLILILIVSPLYAQFDVWGQFGGNPFSFYDAPMNRGVTYNVRALAFFDRVTALGKTLTTAQKQTYDSIFVRLQDSALIGSTRAGDSLSAYYMIPLRISIDTNIAKLNLLDTAYTLVNNGGVFTDTNWIGGTGKFLDTQMNSFVDSSIFKRTSCSFGYYSRTFNSQYAGDMTRDGGQINISSNYLDGNTYVGLHSSSYIGVKFSKAKGFHSLIRNTTANFVYHVNGNDTTIISAFQNYISTTGNFKFGAGYLGGTLSPSTNHYVSAFIGSGLSADKRRKLSNITNEALRQKQLNVY